jgi:4-methyl-5(b-hydroxyethyl)-thiazole monophosphate biosynthesis
MVLVPDTTLEEALKQEYDMVVLPGGLPGADYLNNDSRIRALLTRMAANDRFTAAICAAPKVLANAGLLKGRKATAYPGVLDAFEGLDYRTDSVVRDGKVITSRGPGTAMDFALELVEILAGKQTRDQVEVALQRPH